MPIQTGKEVEFIEERTPSGAVRYYQMSREVWLMRIHDEAQQCVVFIGCTVQRVPNWLGTAFLIGIPRASEVPGDVTSYLVTSRHVIESLHQRGDFGSIMVCANFRDKQLYQMLETEYSCWFSHPTSDVSVLRVSDYKSFEKFDCTCVPDSLMLNRNQIITAGLTPGDGIFMPGLFSALTTQNRLVPVMRSGTIAALPDDAIRVHNRWDIKVILAEVRSIAGNSGAPVFVRRNDRGYALIGVYHGIWGKEPQGLGEERIESGIGIVVPCDDIAETIKMAESRRDKTIDIPD